MKYIDHDSELSWRSEQETQERRQARRERMEEQDFSFDRVAAAKCDGSGVIEECYLDADQVEQIPCPGCYNCALREAQGPEFHGSTMDRAADELDAILTAALAEPGGEDEFEYRRRVA